MNEVLITLRSEGDPNANGVIVWDHLPRAEINAEIAVHGPPKP